MNLLHAMAADAVRCNARAAVCGWYGDQRASNAKTVMTRDKASPAAVSHRPSPVTLKLMRAVAAGHATVGAVSEATGHEYKQTANRMRCLRDSGLLNATIHNDGYRAGRYYTHTVSAKGRAWMAQEAARHG